MMSEFTDLNVTNINNPDKIGISEMEPFDETSILKTSNVDYAINQSIDSVFMTMEPSAATDEINLTDSVLMSAHIPSDIVPMSSAPHVPISIENSILSTQNEFDSRISHENTLPDESNSEVIWDAVKSTIDSLENTSSEINSVEAVGQSNANGVKVGVEVCDPKMICRLCAEPCKRSEVMFFFRSAPHKDFQKDTAPEHKGDDDYLLTMLKATLPIKVSCCDQLPKQICTSCFDKLRLSHSFITSVLEVETRLSVECSEASNNNLTNGIGQHFPSAKSKQHYCPICCEDAVQSKPKAKRSKRSFNESIAFDGSFIKPELGPSNEEMERTYKELFNVDEPVRRHSYTEERLGLQPKSFHEMMRRPRGRPRTKPRVTPRGRRGRRSTQTTVERILELGRTPSKIETSCIRVRSGESSTSGILSQCLLCERWFPGVAACLQHSLLEHTDCGVFLCPRCPRDDFPGEFELIQHYQEAHCPDLELYEISEPVSKRPRNYSDMEWGAGSDPMDQYTEIETLDMDNLDNEQETQQQKEEQKRELTKTNCNNESQECSNKLTDDDYFGARPQPPSTRSDCSWQVETMEFESSNAGTPSPNLDESQDEMSSNMSELAPRSVTSHSAIYEEESNSILTQESDSNLALEDRSLPDPSNQAKILDQLPDQIMDHETSSDLIQSEFQGNVVQQIKENEEDEEESEELDEKEENDTYISSGRFNDDDDQDNGNCGNGGSNTARQINERNQNVSSGNQGDSNTKTENAGSNNAPTECSQLKSYTICISCRKKSIDLMHPGSQICQNCLFDFQIFISICSERVLENLFKWFELQISCHLETFRQKWSCGYELVPLELGRICNMSYYPIRI